LGIKPIGLSFSSTKTTCSSMYIKLQKKCSINVCFSG
jgi:hypothetical protein